MRKVYFLLFALLCAATITNAQVSVTATAGTPGPTSYTTLKLAFDAINAGTHQGAITIDISGNTTEGATPATLNSSGAGTAVYTSVLIRPTADGVSISGNPAAGFGVIQLKGADNVTIDGDNPNSGGTNKNLTINNTAAATVVGNSVIRIATATNVTSADNITIKNCILNGNVTGGNASATTSATGSAGISFGIYVGGNGGSTATDAPTAITSATANTAPSGTTVNNLLINNNDVNLCSRGIAFNGAVASVSTGVTISNNRVGAAGSLGAYPFSTLTSTVYTKGIWVAGTNAINISGNIVRNILSYVATPISGIELSGAIGSGTIVIDNNNVSGISLNAASSSNAARGISVAQSGGPYSITNNTISNINNSTASTTLTTQPNAIFVSTTAASATISGNNISTVVDRNSGTFGVAAVFLNGGNNITFSNNFVSDVNQDITGGFAFSTSFGISGIRVAAGTGHKIYHNSVNLFGSMLGTASSSHLTAALAITSTTLTGIDVRNNIFSNTMTGGTTSIAHVAIWLPSGATSSMNLTLNNNAYYSGPTAASQGIAQVGATAGTQFYLASNFNSSSTSPATNFRNYSSTLSATGTNDNASFGVSTAAPFASATNLHIPNGTTTILESAGANIGVTNDIDGDARTVATPDIGADEFNGVYVDATSPSITYTPLGNSCATANRTLSGVTITDLSGVPTSGSLRPRIYYRKNAGSYFSQPGTLTSGTGTNGTWDFTIVVADMGGVVAGDVISYYVIAQDVSPAANISSNPSGAVATDVNTITTPPASPNTQVIGATLNGTYTVGVGGDYTTLTSAVNAYNSGCLAGPIVFNLIDATYPTETFPITINQNSFASSTNTLTIKPATTATISGAAASGALIRIFGSYVTINGSNSGGSTRDLTITNTSTTSPSVLVIGSVGTTPVTNSGIKNTNVINGVSTSSAVLVGDGPSLAGAGGYFNNITIQNNSIQKAYIGIYSWAISAAGNGSISITQNDLNTAGANSIRLVGIYVQGADGAVVSNNNIGNIANTLDASNLTGIWLATATVNTTISGNTISGISGTSAGPRGIAISSGVANTNIMITGNTITNLSSSAAAVSSGIMLFSTTVGVTIEKNRISRISNTTASGTYGLNLGTTSTGANINVTNNFISDITSLGSSTSTSNGNGIIVLAGSGYNIYHNTVNLGVEQSAAAGIPAAINITSGVTTAGAIDLRNNIFSTSQTVGTNRYAIYSGAANTVFSSIDYNDYYTTGSNLGFIGSNRADLTAIQAGFGGNTNSKNIQPVFQTPSDLHLNPGFNPTLNNLGTPIATVTTDIDGQARSATTPDMGADEFTPCTPPTTATASSNSPVCTTTTLNLTGTTDGTTFSWTGPNGFTSTAQNPSIANVTAAAAGTYTFQSFLAGCPSLASTTTVAVNPSPTVTSVGSSSSIVCDGVAFDLTSAGVSNTTPITLVNESFEGGLPAGWVSIKGATGNLWTPGPINGTARTGTKNMEYNWNSTQPGSAYLITSGLSLTAGVTYTISSWYKGSTFTEKLKVTVGTGQTIADQTTVIQDIGAFALSAYTQQSATFTPAVSGTYYFGWNCYSDPDQFHLDLDDILITAPAAPPTYSWTSNPVGFTSNLQNPTGVTQTGTRVYTVTLTNSFGCTASSPVTVTSGTPALFNVTGGGSVCVTGGSPVAIGLSGSESGVNYQLVLNGSTNVGAPVPGSGTSITFGTHNTVGTYTVVATNATTTCTATMTGSAVIANYAPLNISSTTIQPTTCVAADGAIDLTVTGTAGPFTYTWTTVGGSGLTPGAQDQTGLTVGQYTVVVTDQSTGCQQAPVVFNLSGPGSCATCPIIGSVATNPSASSCANTPVTITASGLVSMGVTYGIKFVTSSTALADPYTGGTVIGTVANGSLTGGGTTASITTSTLPVGNNYIYAILSPTPIDPACRPSSNVYLLVGETPTVDNVSNQVVCNNSNTAPVTFTSPVSGTTFTWTNNTTSIGLAANGTGNIPTFVATNTGTAPVTATITVTPNKTTTGSLAVSKTFTYTGAAQSWVVPAGVTSVRITAKGAAGGTVTGNGGPFNGGRGASMTGDFTVTPGQTLDLIVGGKGNPDPSSSGGGGGTGVNRAGVALIVAGGGAGIDFQDVGYANIHGVTTTAGQDGNGNGGSGGTAGGNGADFAWTPDDISRGGKGWNAGAGGTFGTNGSSTHTTSTNGTWGLGGGGGSVGYGWCNCGAGGGGYSGGGSANINASGGGGGSLNTGTNQNNIAGNNTGDGEITIEYVSSFTTTCAGTPKTFTITVNPTPTVNAISNQTLCNGSSTAAVNFTGAVSGTVYNWTNNTTSIGLGANGTGNIPTFVATNTGTAPVTATITVTPSYTNGAVTCNGTPVTFTITVNPTPTVNAVSNQTLCNGSSTAAVNFTGAVSGTVYNWTNNTTSIGLGANGTGNIPSFVATNTGTAPVTATITVTPSYTNGAVTCNGTPRTFTITVNPTPNAVATPASQTICSGTAITTIVLSSGVSGTAYTWTRNNTGTVTGIAASGSGNISGTLTNTAASPTTVTFTITPTANGCPGTPITATVTVQQALSIVCPANITAPNTPTACGATVTYTPTINGTPAPTVTYVFTGATTGSGSGNGSGSVFNVGVTTVALTATSTCGTATCSFTVTVTDTRAPAITTQPVSRSFCENTNATFTVVATNGASYQWQQFNGTSFVNVAGGTNATLTIPNVTPSMNTNTFRVIVTGPCGSTVTSNNVTLGVYRAASVSIVASPASIQPNQTATLTAVVNNGLGTFVWSYNGSVLPGQTGPSVGPLFATAAGTYRVVYTDPNGCVATSADQSLSAIVSDVVLVYPNPNFGQFHVRYYNAANEKATINVYNPLGQRVYRKEFTTAAPYTQLDVDLGFKANGVYTVEVVDGSGKIRGTKRILVNKN